jgi:carboxymethylenebutenolidase
MKRRMLLLDTAECLAGMAAIATLPSCHVSEYASAAQIANDDPRLRTERVALDVDWGKLDCYLARPDADAEPHPGVIVAHDKLGLTPHFEEVTRRLALEGFVTLAPDYASRFGGTPTEAGPALETVGMETRSDMVADTQVALVWLKSNGVSNGKIGAVGFGLGATAIDDVVTKGTALNGAVIFYGHPPPLADVGAIKTPLLLNLAGKDQFVDPEIPAFVDVVKKTGVKAEIFIYENTERGFDDDSNSAHYSAEAAKLAWSRTIEFLKVTLG